MPTVVTTKYILSFPVTACYSNSIAFASPPVLSSPFLRNHAFQLIFQLVKLPQGFKLDILPLSIQFLQHHQLLDDHSQEYWYQYP